MRSLFPLLSFARVRAQQSLWQLCALGINAGSHLGEIFLSLFVEAVKSSVKILIFLFCLWVDFVYFFFECAYIFIF